MKYSLLSLIEIAKDARLGAVEVRLAALIISGTPYIYPALVGCSPSRFARAEENLRDAGYFTDGLPSA